LKKIINHLISIIFLSGLSLACTGAHHTHSSGHLSPRRSRSMPINQNDVDSPLIAAAYRRFALEGVSF